MLQRRHRRPVELQVVGEADRAAGDRERRDQDRLEDEEERHQAAEAERLERFAQIEIAAAAAGQRRAELRVDEAVGEREDEAGDPGIDDVRAVHGGDHERNGQERADPNHRNDVGGRGLQQAHARRGLEVLRCEVSRFDHSIAATSRSATCRWNQWIQSQGFNQLVSVTSQRSVDCGAFVGLDALDQLARAIGDLGRPLAGCGPFASTRQGTSTMSSGSRNGSVPRLATLSGMMAPWFLTMARMVISAMRS